MYLLCTKKFHLPGARADAEASDTLDCKLLIGAGAAMRILVQIQCAGAINTIVLVIATKSAEDIGEWPSTKLTKVGYFGS